LSVGLLNLNAPLFLNVGEVFTHFVIDYTIYVVTLYLFSFFCTSDLQILSFDGVPDLFFLIIYLFTCAYIVWVISPPFSLPYPLPPSPSFSGRTCSALISNFVEEKTQP
jgi:hypothetical protein